MSAPSMLQLHNPFSALLWQRHADSYLLLWCKSAVTFPSSPMGHAHLGEEPHQEGPKPPLSPGVCFP